MVTLESSVDLRADLIGANIAVVQAPVDQCLCIGCPWEAIRIEAEGHSEVLVDTIESFVDGRFSLYALTLSVCEIPDSRQKSIVLVFTLPLIFDYIKYEY